MHAGSTLTAVVVLAVLTAPAHAQAQGLDVARRYRDAHGPAILRDFADLLSIPNVASDRRNIRRNADEIISRLQEVGVSAEALELAGANPVVYGNLQVPGATRTLGIYVHYDGQPVDPSNWTNDPWEPTLYTRMITDGGRERPFPRAGEAIDPEWRLYARSAGDDKLPIGALIPVLRALQEEGLTPTSNLIFLFDGEEEAGSVNLETYLREYRDRFESIDLWLFFDGPVHQSGRPQITYGVRGFTGMSLTVYGATRSLHSGHYGNWAPVPGQILANLLATMKDPETGEVLVEGFYDTVDPVGPEEMQALAALPRYDEELKRELGLVHTEGEGQTLPERLLLPSLTIRGLSSGNVGALARNIIPATAEAVLGIRLVRGNDPDQMIDLVEAHIRAQGFHIVREDPDMETRLQHAKIVKIDRDESGYPAARTSMDDPVAIGVVEAARQAARSAIGSELIVVPALGGSLPLYLFSELLETPAIVVPVANHDNNQHAPDENVRIANLWYAIDLYAALLTIPGGMNP